MGRALFRDPVTQVYGNPLPAQLRLRHLPLVIAEVIDHCRQDKGLYKRSRIRSYGQYGTAVWASEQQRQQVHKLQPDYGESVERQPKNLVERCQSKLAFSVCLGSFGMGQPSGFPP